MEPIPLLTSKETAHLLGVRLGTLEAWRTRGLGPRFIRISSRCIRYEPGALREWMASRTTEPAERATR